jgi:hypothetical protein
MPSTVHNIRLIESLEKRLQAVAYQDRDTLGKLCTEIRIIVRRVFGDQSVYAHDLELLRFEPQEGIYNSEHYKMTGAWKDGCVHLAELLRAMKTELSVYGESDQRREARSIPWLLKNMSWEAWAALAGLLLTAVSLGVALGQTTFVKEFIGR